MTLETTVRNVLGSSTKRGKGGGTFLGRELKGDTPSSPQKHLQDVLRMGEVGCLRLGASEAHIAWRQVDAW